MAWLTEPTKTPLKVGTYWFQSTGIKHSLCSLPSVVLFIVENVKQPVHVGCVAFDVKNKRYGKHFLLPFKSLYTYSFLIICVQPHFGYLSKQILEWLNSPFPTKLPFCVSNGPCSRRQPWSRGWAGSCTSRHPCCWFYHLKLHHQTITTNILCLIMHLL